MKKVLIVLVGILCGFVGFSQRTTSNEVVFGTLRDARNGKMYKTITVRDKVWMAENLNYQIENMIAFAPNGDEANVAELGYLYRYGINTPEVCPEGWRLPTKEEFEMLISVLAVPPLTTTTTVSKTSTTTTPKTKVDLLNEDGFGIKFAGINGAGTQGGYFYDDFGTQAWFWTSTSVNVNQYPHFSAIKFDKSTGNYEYMTLRADNALSVRCIKK